MPKFREERIRDNMTEKEKMLAGMIYDPSDKTLDELRVKAHKLSQMYNNRCGETQGDYGGTDSELWARHVFAGADLF